jgi:pyrroloquinoline quinone biosynthesis protein D
MSQAAQPWTDGDFRPQLADGVRLHWDRHDQRSILLHPEGVLRPSETGVAILALCDGRRSIAEIAAVLAGRYGRESDGVHRDLIDFLDQLRARVLVRASVGDEPVDTRTDIGVAGAERSDAPEAAKRRAPGAPPRGRGAPRPPPPSCRHRRQIRK